MKWFLDLPMRAKLLQASAQNVASAKQTEMAAQNLPELGQKRKLLVAQYEREHTRNPLNDLNPERVC